MAFSAVASGPAAAGSILSLGLVAAADAEAAAAAACAGVGVASGSSGLWQPSPEGANPAPLWWLAHRTWQRRLTHLCRVHGFSRSDGGGCGHARRRRRWCGESHFLAWDGCDRLRRPPFRPAFRRPGPAFWMRGGGHACVRRHASSSPGAPTGGCSTGGCGASSTSRGRKGRPSAAVAAGCWRRWCQSHARWVSESPRIGAVVSSLHSMRHLAGSVNVQLPRSPLICPFPLPVSSRGRHY